MNLETKENKMTVATTSIDVYNKIQKEGLTGKQHLLILKCLKDSDKEMTLQEISKKTGIAINAVSGRVNELKNDKLIMHSSSKRLCTITNRTVQPVILSKETA